MTDKTEAIAAAVAAEWALKKLVRTRHQLRQALDQPVADYALVEDTSPTGRVVSRVFFPASFVMSR